MHRKGFISIAINCVQYVKSLTELWTICENLEL
jgi:hypothetical protein